MQTRGYAERRRQFVTLINEANDCLDNAFLMFGIDEDDVLASLDNAAYAIGRARDVVVIRRLS